MTEADDSFLEGGRYRDHPALVDVGESHVVNDPVVQNTIDDPVRLSAGPQMTRDLGLVGSLVREKIIDTTKRLVRALLLDPRPKRDSASQRVRRVPIAVH